MTVIATENPRLSNVVKHEYEPSLGWCREVVTVNGAAAELVVGTVLGKVTATGKYKVAVETATDGSKVPAAVVIEDKSLKATTDTGVLAIVRGPAIVSKGGLVLDATYDNATKVDAALGALATSNILANETV